MNRYHENNRRLEREFEDLEYAREIAEQRRRFRKQKEEVNMSALIEDYLTKRNVIF